MYELMQRSRPQKLERLRGENSASDWHTRKSNSNRGPVMVALSFVKEIDM